MFLRKALDCLRVQPTTQVIVHTSLGAVPP
jgi:hypothetical protein